MNDPRIVTTLSCILLFLGSVWPAVAQNQAGLFLSKNADFSTEDRSFDREDVLYVKVVAPQIDFTDIDKNEFRLKPDDGGNDIEHPLTNNFDGTYTTVVDLSQTDRREDDWEVRVRVEDDDGREFRTRVDIVIGRAGDVDFDDEVEFTGRIDSLTTNSIVVDGTRFLVNDSTVVLDNDNNPIDFSQLVAGLVVEIKGFRQPDGSLLAVRIKIEDRDDDEVELTGEIERIEGNSLVVAGLTFFVSDNTVILDNDNNPITLADLMVGMIVEIRADVQVDGSLLATDIKIEDRLEDEVEVRGVADGVADSTLTVLGRDFVVLARTVVLDNNDNPVDLTAITPGTIVQVRADLLPGGVLVALRIKIEDNDPTRVRVQGPVDAVVGDRLIVAGIRLLLDAGTSVTDRDGNAATPADLAAGQTVDVDAVAQETGPPVATSVRIKKVARMTGTVAQRENDRITIGGTSFTIDDNVLVLGLNNELLGTSVLATGQIVQVSARSDGQNLIATKIEILEGSSVATSIEEIDEVPRQFVLNQNYPNPFNPTTTISFDMLGADPASVTLIVYNVLGQPVRTLVDGRLNAGHYEVEWDGRNNQGQSLASGLYLYRLRSAGRQQTRTMVLLK